MSQHSYLKNLFDQASQQFGEEYIKDGIVSDVDLLDLEEDFSAFDKKAMRYYPVQIKPASSRFARKNEFLAIPTLKKSQ